MPGADGLVVGIKNAGLQTCARLDHHFGAERFHFLDGIGSGGNPRLGGIDFGDNCDFHNASRFIRPVGGRLGRSGTCFQATTASANSDKTTTAMLGLFLPVARPMTAVMVAMMMMEPASSQ